MHGRILSIGECMVELRQGENGSLLKSFAGDTFNTAYYLRAFLPKSISVDYFTAVGTDAMSDEMISFMEGAGIGSEYVRRVPGRSPGLYMIHLKGGERSFSYWRSASAARLLADDRQALRGAIDASEVVYFSGITLAILAGNAANTFLDEIVRAKTLGKTIAFDPNIRPALWQDSATMRHMISGGARTATIVLPSFEDEATNFGDASISETIFRYRALGVGKIVVKNGAGGITLNFDGNELVVPAVAAEKVIDTTGAGDSFNAAFLAKYLSGCDFGLAAHFAAFVATTVITRHGALLGQDQFQLSVV